MRIIAGKAGRVAIQVPRGVARPTTDFVRQAVFSILGDKVEGARVLDLYAGSGAIGLEALSRGAASCTFVEENRAACAVIGKNLEKARLEGGRVVKSEVAAFLRRETLRHDLIFADPPYWKHYGDKDHLGDLLSGGLPQPLLADGGWLVAEVSARHQSPDGQGLGLIDRREYGGSAILLYSAMATTAET
jgi:16S rRNA (guanine966-N2)-methyltransferase